MCHNEVSQVPGAPTFYQRKLLGKSMDELIATSEELERAHRQMQKLEAGANPSISIRTDALFLFLDAMCFFPLRVSRNGGGAFPVDQVALVAKESGGYAIFFNSDEGGIVGPMDLLGPISEFPGQIKITSSQIIDVVEQAFPDAHLEFGSFKSKEGEMITLATWREEFLPPDGMVAPTGAASCVDITVAMMQAAIRMAQAIVVENIAAEGVLLASRVTELKNEARRKTEQKINPVRTDDGKVFHKKSQHFHVDGSLVSSEEYPTDSDGKPLDLYTILAEITGIPRDTVKKRVLAAGYSEQGRPVTPISKEDQEVIDTIFGKATVEDAPEEPEIFLFII